MQVSEKISSYASVRQKRLQWLIANNLPPLSVAPAQDPYKYHKILKAIGNKGTHCPLTTDLKPIPIFTGKNPSYLDENGKPQLINHQAYQTRMPSNQEIKRWFANEDNGIGTLGSDRIKWIDLDVKQFASQEKCDRAMKEILTRQPQLKQTLLEKTHSGGYRIGVKVKQAIEFTNFCLEPEGIHVGECLGYGRFTVLAPTIGMSGEPYESMNCPERLVEIEQIDFIYPTKEKTINCAHSSISTRPLKTKCFSGAIELERLGHNDSRRVLNGEDFQSDRSESLTTAIREWAGWSNWCRDNSVTIIGTVEELAYDAAERLGIDSDRVSRILKTIALDECQPAAVYRGNDESCWRKVRRIDKGIFEAHCPDSIKKDIDGGIPPNQKGNGDSGGNGGNDGNKDGYLPERNNWNAPTAWNGELGYWVEQKNKGESRREFTPKCNFDLEIERELSDAEGGGLLLQVKRSVDSRQKRVIIRSIESLTVKEFALALTKTYGKGIVCNLKTDQLGALLHTKLVAYRERGGETFLLADRIGQQKNGTWIFSDRFFTRTGESTSEEKSKIVFNPNLGAEDKIFTPEIAKSDPQALERLVKAAHRFHGESQIDAAIFTLGWATACLHFQEIIKVEKHFPLLNLYGDPGSCKTVMAESALSLAGWLGGNGQFRKITESALYEHLKLCGSLPLCFDDPDKSPWLDGLIQGLYNAKPRVVRGNEQTPQTSLMLTTNHLVGDNKPSTLSRLIGVAVFSSTDGDSQAWDELVAAQKEASGALSQLIALGYPAVEIRELSRELRAHLPHAHVRVADSIALVLWYAMAVCRLSGFDEGRIKHYAIANLCKLANDADSASDSLTDFLDNLSALHAQSLVGEWDCRVVKTREGMTALALNMPSVWGKVDKVYNPPYSRRVIESQISASGGVLKSVQKFYRSQDEVKAYRRALVAGGNQGDNYVPPSPPEEVTRKCVLIPTHLVKDFLAAWSEKDCSLPVTSLLPTVTSELPSKSNFSNPHQLKDLDDSNSSSYLFQKEVNSFKESSGNLKNLETRKLQENFVEENAITVREKVTESDERSENLAPQRNTDSYLSRGNEEITKEISQVTELVEPMVMENTSSKFIESTEEEKESECGEEGEAKGDNERLKSASSVTDSSSTEVEVNDTPQKLSDSKLKKRLEVQRRQGLSQQWNEQNPLQVGDRIIDVLTKIRGVVVGIEGEKVFFSCREFGRVWRGRELLVKI